MLFPHFKNLSKRKEEWNTSYKALIFHTSWIAKCSIMYNILMYTSQYLLILLQWTPFLQDDYWKLKQTYSYKNIFMVAYLWYCSLLYQVCNIGFHTAIYTIIVPCYTKGVILVSIQHIHYNFLHIKGFDMCEVHAVLDEMLSSEIKLVFFQM